MPVPYVCCVWKVPSPLPSSTPTVLSFTLTTARSAMPSPLKSPLATPYGVLPVVYVCCCRKLDMPGPASPTLPRFTSVVRSVKLAVPVGPGSPGNPNPNTAAVKSQLFPSGWSVSVVMVGSTPVTVSCCGPDWLAWKKSFALYCAFNWNVPGANLVFSVAVPVAFTTWTVANTCLPLKKLTVPTVTGTPLVVTVAVSVTTCPGVAGFGATVTDVVVDWGAAFAAKGSRIRTSNNTATEKTSMLRRSGGPGFTNFQKTAIDTVPDGAPPKKWPSPSNWSDIVTYTAVRTGPVAAMVELQMEPLSGHLST